MQGFLSNKYSQFLIITSKGKGEKLCPYLPNSSFVFIGVGKWLFSAQFLCIFCHFLEAADIGSRHNKYITKQYPSDEFNDGNDLQKKRKRGKSTEIAELKLAQEGRGRNSCS